MCSMGIPTKTFICHGYWRPHVRHSLYMQPKSQAVCEIDGNGYFQPFPIREGNGIIIQLIASHLYMDVSGFSQISLISLENESILEMTATSLITPAEIWHEGTPPKHSKNTKTLEVWLDVQVTQAPSDPSMETHRNPGHVFLWMKSKTKELIIKEGQGFSLQDLQILPKNTPSEM